jgi:hypothetical protein
MFAVGRSLVGRSLVGRSQPSDVRSRRTVDRRRTFAVPGFSYAKTPMPPKVTGRSDLLARAIDLDRGQINTDARA